HVAIHKLHLRVLQLDKWNGRWENNFAGLSGELQGGSRRRLLTRSRMSKRNFERKLTSYSTRRMEGLCANTHINAGEGARLTQEIRNLFFYTAWTRVCVLPHIQEC